MSYFAVSLLHRFACVGAPSLANCTINRCPIRYIYPLNSACFATFLYQLCLIGHDSTLFHTLTNPHPNTEHSPLVMPLFALSCTPGHVANLLVTPAQCKVHAVGSGASVPAVTMPSPLCALPSGLAKGISSTLFALV